MQLKKLELKIKSVKSGKNPKNGKNGEKQIPILS